MSDSPSRQFPIPVVRAIITNSSGQLLLLRRDNTGHGSGSWCLPGGKIDYCQTIEDALARELQEETSLKLVSADLFFVQNSLPLTPGGMHCINLYFVCRVTGNLGLNRESSEFAWVGATEVGTYDIVFRNDEAINRFFASEKY